MHRAASVNRPILLNCSSCRARRGRGQHGRHVSTPHFALDSPHPASTMSTTMASRLPLQRITVEEYYRMAETGRLAPEARVELIEGTIVDMPPIGSLHSEVVSTLHKLLLLAVGERAVVRGQQPLRLSDYS